MSLTNSQYDTIMRHYNQIQAEHRREQHQRILHAQTMIPRLAEINGEIASLSVRKARARLLGAADFDLPAAIAARSEERRALLAAHGLPADYLELTYSCPICQDTGFTRDRAKCICFRKAETALLYRQSHLEGILQEENFDTFCPEYYSDTYRSENTGRSSRETALNALDKARQFVRNFPSGDNLFLYGNTGTGKTFLSHCIAKDLLDRGFGVVYYSAHDLFELISAHTFQNAADTEDIYQYLFGCDLLIIDDLGTEVTNGFISSSLFQLVNERLLNHKSVIISTNLTLDHFAAVYSERTFSRITSGYSMIRLFGDDIRIRKRLMGQKAAENRTIM